MYKQVIVFMFLILIIASCDSKNNQHINTAIYARTDGSIIQVDIDGTNNFIKKCPENMVEISGNYCSDLEEICLKYGDPNNKGANGPVQCLEFKYPTRCLSKSTIQMHYCIDKYPYPNIPEELPTTQLTWYQAKNLCEQEGKRLCTTHEFTQACRGPDNKPYPYATGYIRDCSKCNCDIERHIDPSKSSFEELDRRVQLGSMPECISDYGVYDLVGNNDRWVINESGRPYISALVGGHEYKGARARCSPSTLAHGPTFSWFETGALCCKDMDPRP